MKLWNTLTGQKEEFLPQGDPIKMYVCGVTPYDEAHVGHAMSYIIFDAFRRYLEYRGFRVRHVQNFTDIDDKLIARAQRLAVPVSELAEGYIASYFKDMDALNVKRADLYPRVTEEVPAIIDLIERLVEKDFAYASDGDVYFRVERAEGYGKLSHRSLESMIAGARVEVAEGKQNSMDFVLWKGAKPGEPQWGSPWGAGRPGWHIECSAMATKYLGETIDIHGGGQDLIFPHHENEIAQSEAATGAVPFVKFWLHNGLLRLGEEKMSKSLGNLVTVKEVLAAHTADALRLFVLTSHYRSPLTYSDEALDAAERGTERLREALRQGSGQALRHGSPADEVGAQHAAPLRDITPFKQRFVDAMEDDFNTAQAAATLFDLARDINRGREAGADIRPAQDMLRELGGVLGLTFSVAEGPAMADASPFIDLLLEVRNELRASRNFPLADKIRDGLMERGVTVEDSSAGTNWRRKR